MPSRGCWAGGRSRWLLSSWGSLVFGWFRLFGRRIRLSLTYLIHNIYLPLTSHFYSLHFILDEHVHFIPLVSSISYLIHSTISERLVLEPEYLSLVI